MPGLPDTWRRILTGAVVALAGGFGSTAAGAMADATPAVEVSAGAFHTCALLTDGSVDCWGENESGQLGDGTRTSSTIPVPVSGLTDAVQVSAGSDDTCALLVGGTVDCWGQGTEGQLGNGATADSPVPVPVSGLDEVSTIAVGWGDACALTFDATVHCWGHNSYGQLGDGSTSDSLIPVVVPGLEEVSQITAGSFHGCATHFESASIDCWGLNIAGQLGDGSTENRSTPVPVAGVNGAVQIAGGNISTCALLSTGDVDCWGTQDLVGEVPKLTPVPVSLGGEASRIAVGGIHACALLTGAVECWGQDGYGQLGNGAVSEGSSVPVRVAALGDATEVSAGAFHTCALVAGGSIECWGVNNEGQLGNGTTTNSSTPRPITYRGEGTEAIAGTPSPGSELQPRVPASNGTATPVFGKRVTLSPVSGSILVKSPGHRSFVPLAATDSVPLGTVIDASRGTVEIFAAGGPQPETQSGLFGGGVFRIAQRLSRSPFHPGRVGLTVLTLTGGTPRCGAAAGSLAARASSRGRGGNHLWGDAHGNFQTGGRFASATVGGTKWLTAETCAGTRVKVARGVVSVTDRLHHRRILVTAPHSYLARR